MWIGCWILLYLLMPIVVNHPVQPQLLIVFGHLSLCIVRLNPRIFCIDFNDTEIEFNWIGLLVMDWGWLITCAFDMCTYLMCVLNDIRHYSQCTLETRKKKNFAFDKRTHDRGGHAMYLIRRIALMINNNQLMIIVRRVTIT